MLKLIRALSEYNGPTYDGAVMARAVIKASVLENGDYSTRPVKMAPPRMGIIEAYKEGAASLTVTLLLNLKCLLLRENRLTYTKTARRLTVTAEGASCLR